MGRSRSRCTTADPDRRPAEHRTDRGCQNGRVNEPDLEAAATVWREFRLSHPDLPESLPTVGPFGDGPALADELLGHVVAGRKRATATLAAEFSDDGEPMPRPGEHWIVTDGSGAPAAIVRTIELRLGAFLSVDDAFAFDEGEDDRTRASWIREHRRYWLRQCERLGIAWTEDAEILFERFEVVWLTPSRATPPSRTP